MGGKPTEAEIRKEMREHPQLTRSQAARIASQHDKPRENPNTNLVNLLNKPRRKRKNPNQKLVDTIDKMKR